MTTVTMTIKEYESMKERAEAWDKHESDVIGSIRRKETKEQKKATEDRARSMLKNIAEHIRQGKVITALTGMDAESWGYCDSEACAEVVVQALNYIRKNGMK